MDRLELLYVPSNYFLRAVQAVVIPTPAVSDLQAHISLLDTVLGTGLTVMGLAGGIYFDMGNERLNCHRTPPLRLPRGCRRILGQSARAFRARTRAVVPFPYRHRYLPDC